MKVYLTICGEEILVEKKKIKNMYLRVTRPEGRVKITAPLSMSEKNIREFAEGKWGWILEQRKHISETQASEESLSEHEMEELKKEYRKQMLAILPHVIEKCEKITGLHAEEWRLRDMKTRWGTCNVAKKRIWLNIQLAAYPRECLEYVVLHELTHLLERGHNKVFWGYMDQFCPNWREIRKRLNGK